DVLQPVAERERADARGAIPGEGSGSAPAGGGRPGVDVDEFAGVSLQSLIAAERETVASAMSTAYSNVGRKLRPCRLVYKYALDIPRRVQNADHFNAFRDSQPSPPATG